MNLLLTKNFKYLNDYYMRIFNYLNRPNNIKKISIIEKNNFITKNITKLNVKGCVFCQRNKFNIDKNPLLNAKFIKKENSNRKSREHLININIGANKGFIMDKTFVKKEGIGGNEHEKDYFNSLIDDYGDEIFSYLLLNENVNACKYNEDIFKLQDKKYYNEKNRIILYHWILKNNANWKLKDETLFTTMNILDRYISKYKSEKTDYQLVALSSYLIATKYEDIYPPNAKKLSFICKNKYSYNDIIQKEYDILVALNFDILYNSSYKFLTFLHSIADKNNSTLFYLSQFILEISIENFEILEFSPSLRALAALVLSKKLLKIHKSWNLLKLFLNKDEKDVRIVQKKMIKLLQKVINSKENNIIYQKFSSIKYNSVSLLIFNLYSNEEN